MSPYKEGILFFSTNYTSCLSIIILKNSSSSCNIQDLFFTSSYTSSSNYLERSSAPLSLVKVKAGAW